MTDKPEPIGIDDFKEMRTVRTGEGQSLVYCDKSLLIKDIVSEGAKVLLFTRPRRFGKTLNMSMLSYFFGTKEPLFDDLKIAAYPHIINDYRDYPVVFLTFKNIKEDTLEGYAEALKQTIYEAFRPYQYLLDSPKVDTALIRPYFSKDFNNVELKRSLKYLTEALHAYHQKQVIFLLDEYDTPLHKAYEKGYFEQIITDFSNLLGALLKGNTALFKGIITGITRVAKENIFSDLNNPGIYDIEHTKYTQYFGFTEEEVKTLVPSEQWEEVKAWYNGYTFGRQTAIYNPLSIIAYLDNNGVCDTYWINSSSNDLIKKTLTASKMKGVQTLIEGEEIEVRYNQHLALRDLDKNDTAFWNLLYTSGYLTSAGKSEDARKTHLKIPNKEVHQFFEDCVMSWFGNGRGEGFLEEFCEALLEGNTVDLQDKLQEALLQTVGHEDVKINKEESFYHGMLLGITLQLKDRYYVKSNRQGGFGRYDIALFPINPERDPGIIIEVKTRRKIQAALTQMELKRYDVELAEAKCAQIVTYGFKFEKMQVEVAMGGLAEIAEEVNEASLDPKKKSVKKKPVSSKNKGS